MGKTIIFDEKLHLVNYDSVYKVGYMQKSFRGILY
jgi:hypothetical protein